MSSSTSSSRATSKAVSEAPSGASPGASPSASPRRIFLKIFLVSVLGMAASLAIIRLITYANDVSGDQFLERENQARAALPRILAEKEDLVMFYGSSMVDAGFAARQFDRQMAERGVGVKSFNFGFGGLNPYFQDYLARRIGESFDAEGRKLELALIEFNPFQTTASRFNGAKSIIDSFLGLLASPEEIWEIAKRDPARGVRIWTIRHLRDGVSAEMITWEFGGFLRPQPPRSELPEDEAAAKRLDEVGKLLNERFEEDYPDYTGEDWYYPWQGAGTIPEERSESTRALLRELYQLQRAPPSRFLDNDKLNRIACCDIEELHFEEELVQAFIRTVKTFQEFSNHVEVVLLPRDTTWIQYSPEAAERLAGVLGRIRAETGVTIKNMQEIDAVTTDMFSDVTHLGRYSGDVAFTAHLVDEYAGLLGADTN